MSPNSSDALQDGASLPKAVVIPVDGFLDDVTDDVIAGWG